MSVRVNLEIGHEASVRTKNTPDGFTHDWEVFVRGTDTANIHHYVEKVIFYLHDTFKNPKRVKKEPPYTVKESGYAGFMLFIEVHLRSKEEPKKLKFEYDLTLQKTGAPIYKLQKEKYVFNAPSEEFKQKLLKGGGVVVTNSQENARENRTSSEEKSQLISKPRLSGSDYIKKHKPKIESNNFQDLFGTPITKTSKPVETKPILKEKSSSNSSSTKPGSSEKDKVKYSPYKDKEKEKDRERFKEKTDFNKKDKDEKRKDDRKERSKDREKKERRDKSPKRSPTPSKRSSSPKRLSSPLPKYKDKDEKKVEVQKKNGDDIKERSEKKMKKDKRDKDKERHESKRKDNQKIPDQKEKNLNNKEKEKVKETSPLVPPKPEKKEKINIKDFIKELENGKIKSDKIEEKPKHKHKKKDKVRDKVSEKEKSYKPEKKIDKGISKDIPKQPEKQASLFDSPKDNKKSEKSTHLVLPEGIDSEASNSSISSPETSFNDQPMKIEPKYEAPPPPLSPHPPSPPVLEIQKLEKQKKEKVKKNKDKKTEKDVERKRKRKSEQKQIEEPLPKVSKDEPPNLNNKESDSEAPQPESEIRRAASEQSEEKSEDYMNVLRDLQQKILTLQDNSELQKVVELIAETGRYEVSAQTFDFDLCLLERSTISQLQNFFESTS